MLYKLKVLKIRRCKNLQSLPELPLFIESVEADDCSSLKMVSTLRSTLVLGRWLDKYDSDGGNYRSRFLFQKCTKLREDAINNIFREFLYKVFCTATTPPEVVDSARAIGRVLVCHPTTEFLGWLKFRNEYERSFQPISHIPRWFNNQSEGCSITIPLPTNWYNPKTFLGFVLSAIVESVKVDSDEFARVSVVPFHFECIVHLLTAGDRFGVDADYRYHHCNGVSGDHIVMFYNYFDDSKVDFEKDYVEASFEFGGLYRVIRCGVRILYLRDAVEKSDVNHSDSVNFESWRIDVDNFANASDDDFQSCGSGEDD